MWSKVVYGALDTPKADSAYWERPMTSEFHIARGPRAYWEWPITAEMSGARGIGAYWETQVCCKVYLWVVAAGERNLCCLIPRYSSDLDGE